MSPTVQYVRTRESWYYFQNLLIVLQIGHILYVQIHRTSLEPIRTSLEPSSALYANRSWRREGKLKANILPAPTCHWWVLERRRERGKFEEVPPSFKSAVWEHFHFGIQYSDEGKKTVNRWKTVCKQCLPLLATGSWNSSNMKSHLWRHHPAVGARRIHSSFTVILQIRLRQIKNKQTNR